MKKLFILSFIIFSEICVAQEIYKDMNAPMHERITDLLGRMTLEEKVSLLHATSPGVERLGIPKYYMGNEALHGVVRPGQFTVFPQSIGLASMWNPELQYKIATAISDEARAKWNYLEQGKNQKDHFSDLLVFWSPTVNMARDPRWGRTPETYGEDPYLSGVIGTEFVKGLQGNDPRYLKIVSTPKHFAANNEEHNRFSCLANIPERDLREYYLPAFERLVREGKAQSIMSAYNAINDVPCTANPWLLTKVLRGDWGFDGYVVSDCGAVSALVDDHNYVKLYETAAAVAMQAGLDIECGDNVYIEPLLKAVEIGMISEAQVDSAAYRLIRSKMLLGVFDDPEAVPYTKISPDVIGCKEHNELALEAARQSIVLLKNDKNMLPLNPKKLKRIAVVGINSSNAEFGDYSGKPVCEPVSALEGIKARLGNDVEIYHEEWINLNDNHLLIANDAFPSGLKAEYFSNENLEGTPAVRNEPYINFDPKQNPPDAFIPQAPMSARWTGEIRCPLDGEYEFVFTNDDGARLYIDDKIIIDDWESHSEKNNKIKVYLKAGKHNLRAEYFDGGEDCVARLRWKTPITTETEHTFNSYGKKMEDKIKACDVVIAVMGINQTIEREGLDRTYLDLPSDQQQFLKELYAANKNVVLVLEAGSSIALNWEQANLPAIIDAWYPGEVGGKAVAEVLFGDYNPAGRLPLTFYKSLDDLPDFNDYDVTKGRTYQYFRGEPLYPFGYGLSYTKFQYKNINVKDAGENLEVSFTVRNVGGRSGDEVSQVYVQYPEQNRPTPIKQLRGFARNTIEKGGSKQVNIRIPKSELRLWDSDKSAFYTPSGTYKIMVGKSSADIVLTQDVVL